MKQEKQIWDEADFGYASFDILIAFSIHVNIYAYTYTKPSISYIYTHIYHIHIHMWCWRRLLRVPWTARRSNQSILKEISPEYSLQGLMLKLKLQYYGHLM